MANVAASIVPPRSFALLPTSDRVTNIAVAAATTAASGRPASRKPSSGTPTATATRAVKTAEIDPESILKRLPSIAFNCRAPMLCEVLPHDPCGEPDSNCIAAVVEASRSGCARVR